MFSKHFTTKSVEPPAFFLFWSLGLIGRTSRIGPRLLPIFYALYDALGFFVVVLVAVASASHAYYDLHLRKEAVEVVEGLGGLGKCGAQVMGIDCWVVVSNIFYFHPYLGKISILTNIFQMGWNHQLDWVGPPFPVLGPENLCKPFWMPCWEKGDWPPGIDSSSSRREIGKPRENISKLQKDQKAVAGGRATKKHDLHNFWGMIFRF